MLCVACHQISILLRQGYFIKHYVLGVWEILIAQYAFTSNPIGNYFV